jgi:hypothetical protein
MHMKKTVISILALTAVLSSSAARANDVAVSYYYYNTSGVQVGTRYVDCDGAETVVGEQTVDEVAVSSSACGAVADTFSETIQKS